MAEGQSSGGGGSLPTSIMVSLPTAPPPPPMVVAPARPIASLSNRKPGVLPANLEEMKVQRRRLKAASTGDLRLTSDFGCSSPTGTLMFRLRNCTQIKFRQDKVKHDDHFHFFPKLQKGFCVFLHFPPV